MKKQIPYRYSKHKADKFRLKVRAKMVLYRDTKRVQLKEAK